MGTFIPLIVSIRAQSEFKCIVEPCWSDQYIYTWVCSPTWVKWCLVVLCTIKQYAQSSPLYCTARGILCILMWPQNHYISSQARLCLELCFYTCVHFAIWWAFRQVSCQEVKKLGHVDHLSPASCLPHHIYRKTPHISLHFRYDNIRYQFMSGSSVLLILFMLLSGSGTRVM